ncbi:hypothetical protein M2163_006278 [Streptomyces sp. SAI-135]|nr:hypothetical protein [Streptomyces sp. SAI-090]MDH6619170.1 hypothetical protein [Streptomyces sp. SAI-135]
MTGVHWVLTGTCLLGVTVVAACGVAGAATGWVLPWARPGVLRPRLWGYGSLAVAAGAAVWVFLGPVAGPPHAPAEYVHLTGWSLWVAGLLIQLRARRPGRAPRDATTTSS